MLANTTMPPPPIKPPLDLRELATVLIKHYGLHSGKYDLMLEFQIGMGMFGSTPETTLPSAMVGISKFGLAETVNVTPNTVDAAIVNPSKKKHPPKKD